MNRQHRRSYHAGRLLIVLWLESEHGVFHGIWQRLQPNFDREGAFDPANDFGLLSEPIDIPSGQRSPCRHWKFEILVGPTRTTGGPQLRMASRRQARAENVAGKMHTNRDSASYQGQGTGQ